MKDWLQSIQHRLQETPITTLGELLPTMRREYFTSASELPLRVQKELNLATAWWCAEASMLAYQPEESIATLTESITTTGWKVQTFGTGEPAFAVLLTSQTAAILAFRGTRVGGFERLDTLFTQPWIDYDDLKTDLAFTPMLPSGTCRIHRGILTRHTEFWNRYEKAITSAIGSLPLYLTGHSLGAALATIAASSGALKSTVALYSFGSPRVGDAAFRDLITQQDLRVHRFVNGHDLITTLAPEGWFGYTHVTKPLHITRDGTAIDDLESHLAGALYSGLPTILESVRNAIHNLRDLRLLTPAQLLVPRDALADHAPVFYVEKIRALALRPSGSTYDLQATR